MPNGLLTWCATAWSDRASCRRLRSVSCVISCAIGEPLPRPWRPSAIGRSSCWRLSSVATDVFGVSGTAMLKALVEGDMAPEAMAELAKGRLRTKLEHLVKALQGRLTEHHGFLLRLRR